MSRNAKRVFLKKKQYSIWLGGKQHRARFHSAEAARAWQRNMRVEFEKKKAGMLTALEPMGIEEVAERFIAHRPHIKTIKHDTHRLNKYVLSKFSGRLLHEISDVEWMALLGDGASKRPGELVSKHKLSPRTSNLIRSVVYSMYKYARVHLQCCRENPIERIKALPVPEKEVPFLPSKEIIAAYLDTAKRDYLYPQLFYVFAMTSLNTGQRLSQVLSIKWEDIDWDGGVIWFRYKFDYVNRCWVEGSKKGDGQHHSVGLNDSLRACLVEWRAIAKYREPEDYVISVERDKPLTLQMTYLCHKRTLEAMNLPHMKVHSLRHTFATMFVEAGGNIYDLKEVLDHSTVQVTERYKRLNRSRKRMIANTFEASAKLPGNVVPLKKAQN